MNNKITSSKTNITLFLIYVVCIGTLSFFHEFWRDELEAFMLVKVSNSFSELFYNSRYEGHPSVWFLMLFVLKFIAPGLLPMKILHLAIASLSGWLVIKYSPFKTIQKIGLLLGYFFFYEYNFIVRNYAIGLLFILIYCSLFPLRKSPKYFIFLALSVVGMMLSNFYSFFIGFSFMILLIAEQFFYKEGSTKLKKMLPGYLLMIIGIIVFVIDTVPPPDCNSASNWNNEFRIGSIIDLFARVWQVFIPIPKSGLNYWNSTIFPNGFYQGLLGLAMVGIVLFIFAQKKLSRLFIFTSFILILSFSYLKYTGYLRHNGHIYIAFVAMLWLQHYLPGRVSKTNKYSEPLLYGLLSAQFIAMLIAVSCEILYPFSQAKNAAAYIAKNYENRIVVGNDDAAASSVCAYLNTSFYYPRTNLFGTYVVWKKSSVHQEINTVFILNKGDSLSKLYKKEILYLSTYPIDSVGKYGLHLQESFNPSVEPKESYYLYTKDLSTSAIN